MARFWHGSCWRVGPTELGLIVRLKAEKGGRALPRDAGVIFIFLMSRSIDCTSTLCRVLSAHWLRPWHRAFTSLAQHLHTQSMAEKTKSVDLLENAVLQCKWSWENHGDDSGNRCPSQIRQKLVNFGGERLGTQTHWWHRIGLIWRQTAASSLTDQNVCVM